MTYCMNCGQPVPNGAKFCSNCGTAIGEVRTETLHRKTIYDGELHKCPNCGELLNSYVTNCPSCGYELRSVKINCPVNELVKKVEKASSVEEKIELIINFYVPNTKEDIYDFFILAVSNLEDTNYDTDDAWQAKLEQTYHKAKISFGNSPEFDYIEKLYNKTRKKVSKRGASNFIRKNKNACITALSVGTGMIITIVGIILMILLPRIDKGGAAILVLFGMFILLSPSLFVQQKKGKEETIRKKTSTGRKSNIKNNSSFQSVGKDADDFIHEYFEDVAEQLRVLGFKNIVVKPEKKGVLDSEGAIKGISIAGNSEFGEDDEFDINSKIIIRYFSKNC